MDLLTQYTFLIFCGRGKLLANVGTMAVLDAVLEVCEKHKPPQTEIEHTILLRLVGNVILEKAKRSGSAKEYDDQVMDLIADQFAIEDTRQVHGCTAVQQLLEISKLMFCCMVSMCFLQLLHSCFS